MEDIKRVLPYFGDPGMKELANRTIGKLCNMTDGEFEQLELVEVD